MFLLTDLSRHERVGLVRYPYIHPYIDVGMAGCPLVVSTVVDE